MTQAMEQAADNRPCRQPRGSDLDRDPAPAERAVGGGGGHLPQHPRGRARLSPTRCISQACSRISRGKSEEAVALIERSLELEPDRADWHSNLGIVLRDRLRLDEAIVAFRRAIALDPNHANALQQSRRRAEGAGPARRGGSGVSGRHSRRSRTLGRLHQPRHPAERPEADARSGGLLLQGHHVQAEASRGAAAAGAGALHARRDRQSGRRSSRNGSKRSRTIRLRCTCWRRAPAATSRPVRRTGSSKRPSTASPPASIPSSPSCSIAPRRWSRGCWRTRVSSRRRALDVLDAGCGTGLCGPLVAPYARRLVGVDLSARMLDAGRRRDSVYDELYQGAS